MDIQQRLTGFAMMVATWIMWVLVGLSVGGVAVALERAIYLILTSETVRKLKVQILGLLRWSAPLDRGGPAVSTFINYTCRFDVQ